MTNPSTPSVVLIEGLRSPFRRSGTDYLDLISYDLARGVLKSLLNRTGLKASEVDQVIMGTVAQHVMTSNVARDAALAAGFPNTVTAHTVTQACISANQAICSGMAAILTGQADTVIAGGTEILSDVPIGFKKEARKRFFESRKYQKPWDYLQFFKGLKLSDLAPQAPAIAEFSTGESMGESADKLAAMFQISREGQDSFALRSHQNAARASREGKLSDVEPMAFAPGFRVLEQDNTFREDSSLEKLAALKPVFSKPFGTVTAGNASPLTDGAAATLIMREDKALALGFKPKAYLRQYTFVAQDPKDELLLGPAYATPKVLDKAKVSFKDLDVIEIHEAFAGQTLAVLAALESDHFAQKMGKDKAIAQGESIDMEKINRWGGSISLGHPFGATGARLVTMAANRLIDEGGQLALVTACAAGGLGHAMLLERYPA
ncbi:MAG: acetyl-CoA C-acyltransferase [Deinococcales bacterium]